MLLQPQTLNSTTQMTFTISLLCCCGAGGSIVSDIGGRMRRHYRGVRGRCARRLAHNVAREVEELCATYGMLVRRRLQRINEPLRTGEFFCFPRPLPCFPNLKYCHISWKQNIMPEKCKHIDLNVFLPVKSIADRVAKSHMQ